MDLARVLALLVVRAEPDFQAASRVVEGVLRIGGRGEAEGRCNVDHASHRVDRYRNLHPHPARRAEFALIDDMGSVLLGENDLAQVPGKATPAHLSLVVPAVIRAVG